MYIMYDTIIPVIGVKAAKYQVDSLAPPVDFQHDGVHCRFQLLNTARPRQKQQNTMRTLSPSLSSNGNGDGNGNGHDESRIWAGTLCLASYSSLVACMTS